MMSAEQIYSKEMIPNNVNIMILMIYLLFRLKFYTLKYIELGKNVTNIIISPK